MRGELVQEEDLIQSQCLAAACRVLPPFLASLSLLLRFCPFTFTLLLIMLYLPALTFSPKLLLVLLRAAFPKSIWALTGLFPCACGMEVPRAPMLPAEAP